MLRKLLLPDIAFCLSALTMLYCLTLYGGRQNLFRDADTGWHIRDGEQIMRQLDWPKQDNFSFSRPNAPWYAWEWLADVLMSRAHAANGLAGVFVLYLGVLGIVTWLWFQLLWTTGAWFIPAAVSSVLMLSTCNIHWLARPHLFGWVFLLLAVLAAEQGWVKQDIFSLAGLFAMGVLWTNLHASFFLGPFIFGLYAGDSFLRQKTWKPLATAATVLCLASFINPYGWQLHFHVVQYLMDRELLSLVSEFQSFQFHLPGSGIILATLLLACAGIPLLVQQRKYARALLSLLLVAGALRSARGLPLTALIALPFSVAAICHSLSALIPRIRQYNENLRTLDRRFGGYALAPLFLWALALTTNSPAYALPAGFAANQFPVELSAQVAQLPSSARIFSSDKFGGYLIYRFAGERKVFFDGRSDFYGAQFLKDYVLIPDLKPGWEEQWQRWNFSHALVAKDSALASMLPLKGWRKIGGDQVAILFEKASN